MSQALAQAVITALAQRQWTLATAESCTGGLLGDWLTNIAGSSVVYLGGIIAYANSAKQTLLHVPTSTLATVGAVSAETALAMAQGTAQALGATVGLSTTGIAGPGGGSPEKPVGLVYLGLHLPNQGLVEQHVWPYDRLGNKQASAKRALEWLLEQLSSA
ncbi:MAG TPA: CinA family protein [Herpetosiphon sp.]|uniref:CinA domain protein n=1 Tax=Herpetosiphon aurantiacus (strain ATCC 23779 / DSM 785 / 114-95) TaxID=316274 RepID=A9B6W3_HERA2|nr:CinA family protein [Herpetosiphon sp.]ABX05831.1 CinA domain protein [Herpetosiphon aurantiacus DSM 785]HBW48758.1 CinA family protein [Herpetosiphon sp.]